MLVDVEQSSAEDIITYQSDYLLKNNYVRASFLDAILKREQVYPTGLPLGHMGVAIPHTDPEHVLNATVSVAILSKPVTFKVMGNHTEEVLADIVFVLAISEPSKQIVMLERLMSLFQNEELMKQLKHASNSLEIKMLLDHVFEISD